MDDTRPAEILSTVQGGVTVPLLRAAVAGFFISLPILIMTAAAAQEYDWARRWWWACWLLSWTITQVAWWLYDERGRKRMQEAVIYAIEMSVGADLNQDGEIGAPQEEPAPITTTETMSEHGYTEGRMGRLPVSPYKAAAFAIGVLYKGKKPTFEEWAGGGKDFSDLEFEKFQGYLVYLKCLKPKSDKSNNPGFEITDVGREHLKNIVRRYAPAWLEDE